MVSETLKQRRQRLIDDESLSGVEFTHVLARETDEWLHQLLADVKGADPKKMALLAVGGYGRAQLAPSSDLDILLVHSGGRGIEKVADQIWYPIWDQGVGLDHSVRTPKEVLQLAHADLRVALGLLDGRLLWGSEQVASDVLSAVRSSWHEQWGHEWLPVLETQMRERHETHGDLADLLEPDIKESHGGLRDLNVLRAVGVSFPDLYRFVDADDLAEAEAVLLTVRVAMHRIARTASCSKTRTKWLDESMSKTLTSSCAQSPKPVALSHAPATRHGGAARPGRATPRPPVRQCCGLNPVSSWSTARPVSAPTS